MRRLILLSFLAAVGWAANNVCTLADGGAGAACHSKTCTTAQIAADTTHANWTGAGCTANGYVPAAPDSIIIPTGYTVTWSSAFSIGGCNGATPSCAPVYSYPTSVTVSDAADSYVTPPTWTFACLSGNGCHLANGGAFTNGANVFMSVWTFMNGSHAVSSVVFRSLNGAWFASGSAAPTMTPSSGSATATVNMMPGGGTAAVAVHGTGQVQIASGYNVTLYGDVTNDAQDTSTGIIILIGHNHTVTFDSSSATPTADGSFPMYSVGSLAANANRGLDFSQCGGTCTITSNTSGGNGILFSHHSWNECAFPQVSTGKEALSYLGSAAMPMYEGGWFSFYQGVHLWEMPSYTCDHCGPILLDSNYWGSGGAANNFIDGGVFTNSLGEANFKTYLSSTATGTRTITNAVYDKGFGDGAGADGWGVGGTNAVTVANSYIANFGNTSAFPFGGISGSMILSGYPYWSNGQWMQLQSSLSNSVFAWTVPATKPQWVNITAKTSITLSDIHFDAPFNNLGQSTKPLFSAQNSPSSMATYSFLRVSLTPTKTGATQQYLGDLLSSTNYTNETHKWEHNVIGGTGGVAQGVVIDESTTAMTGGSTVISSLQSNLMWNTSASINMPLFSEATSTPTADPCGPAGAVICGHNAVESPNLGYAGCTGGCTNNARGYYAKFTAVNTAGGQNNGTVTDLSPVNLHLYLIDRSRWLATWYLDGAHKTASSTWNVSTTPGNTINAGDIYSSVNASYYAGKIVAYRALRTFVAPAQLQPDGPGITPTTVVLTSGYARITFTGGMSACVQLNDYFTLTGTATGAAVYQVKGVASDCSWFEGTGSGGSATYTGGNTGNVDVWFNWWEPATLYQSRLDYAAQATYTDGAYGAVASPPGQAISQWIHAGLTTTLPSLWCSGHDGDSMGFPSCGQRKAQLAAIQ